MNRLEIAKRKRERLQREVDALIGQEFAHQKLTNGQPMNDKRNGPAWFRKQKQYEDRIFSKLDEIKKQDERIGQLEWQQSWLEAGYNKNGGGLRMTVENIPRIEEEIRLYEKGESHFTAVTIRKYKKKLEELYEQKNLLDRVEIDSHVQELIDEGELVQWKKQPMIYFVKGYRKLAVELQADGTLKASEKYYAKTEEEREVIQQLLGGINEMAKSGVETEILAAATELGTLLMANNYKDAYTVAGKLNALFKSEDIIQLPLSKIEEVKGLLKRYYHYNEQMNELNKKMYGIGKGLEASVM